MISQIDISNIVPTIRVPTLVIHRTEDALIRVEAGRFLAQHIPRAISGFREPTISSSSVITPQRSGMRLRSF
jgi:hypothetical protein